MKKIQNSRTHATFLNSHGGKNNIIKVLINFNENKIRG
jgi:hypothetical protein